MKLDKRSHLSQNEAMTRRIILIFLLTAFLTAACSVHAYVPAPERTYDFQNSKTRVPRLMSDRIICRNDPVNRFDPDGNEDKNVNQRRLAVSIETAKQKCVEFIKVASLGLLDFTDAGDAKVALTGSDFSGNNYSPEMRVAAGGMILFGGSIKSTRVPQAGRKFNQLSKRGWSKKSINEVVNKPFTTRKATNKATGNTATAYFREDGHYIVRDDVTGDLVQMSDTNINVGKGEGQWMPDSAIEDPYIPETK